MESRIACGVHGSKDPNRRSRSSTLPGCVGALDPDLFITGVFVSWVVLFALLGLALMRYERRRDDEPPLPEPLGESAAGPRVPAQPSCAPQPPARSRSTTGAPASGRP